jgi:hypothetical protein
MLDDCSYRIQFPADCFLIVARKGSATVNHTLASLYLPFQVVIFVTMQGSLCPMLDTALCILHVDLLISEKVACLECKAAIKTQHLLPHMHYAIRIL